MRIKVLRPLAGVTMMVQRGNDELLAPSAASTDELVFEFAITVDLTERQPNFLGKYAQGPKSGRFIYVNSGSYAAQHLTPWNRRAKISLMSITREQIEGAVADGFCLAAEIQGVGRDGGPTCASVKGINWSVELTGMDVGKYLERIGAAGPLELSASTLALLQRCHLLTIPFENLDIHWKRPIVLEFDRFYEKIVERGRGGFGYELNGLFNELLKSIGFRTRLISARVFNGKSYGPEFDHIA